jgi:hypothetical protein
MIMTENDPFLKHYSNISTTPGVGYGNGNNVKAFNKTIATTTTNDNDDCSVSSSSNIINLGTMSRPSVSGLTCTGDLDYPAAKSLSTLLPVVSKHQQQNQTHPCLDDSANRIYIKEVLSSAACAKKSYNSSLDNCYMPNNGTTSTGSFDLDSFKLLIEKEEKKNKKKEKGGNTKIVNSESNNVSAVHFSIVTIQEYPIQPGDNPGGNTGCPLTIGWDPIGEPVTVQIDLYEKFRSGTSSNGSGDNDNDNKCNNNYRRSNKLKPLVSAHREHILRQLGHTSKSIRAGTKSANQTRRNRYQTIARLKSSKTDEFLESIQRKVHNIITCGEKKRREKKFLAPYLSTSSSSSSNNNKSSNTDESHNSVITFNDDSVGTNCSIKENSILRGEGMIKSMKSKVVSSQRISAINININISP